MVRVVSRERAHQRTVEPRVDAPQGLEETVEALRLFPLERVQQRTSEQIEDVPQLPEETVDVVRFTSRE